MSNVFLNKQEKNSRIRSEVILARIVGQEPKDWLSVSDYDYARDNGLLEIFGNIPLDEEVQEALDREEGGDDDE